MFAAIIKHVNSNVIQKVLGPFGTKDQADRAGLDEARAMCVTSREYISDCPEFMYVVEPIVSDRPDRPTLYVVSTGEYSNAAQTVIIVEADHDGHQAITDAIEKLAQQLGLDWDEIVVNPLGCPLLK